MDRFDISEQVKVRAIPILGVLFRPPCKGPFKVYVTFFLANGIEGSDFVRCAFKKQVKIHIRRSKNSDIMTRDTLANPLPLPWDIW